MRHHGNSVCTPEWLHAGATRVLRSAGTSRDADGVPGQLVESGPFRWTRNPMYLAGVPILGGAGLALGSWLVVPALLAYLGLVRPWVAREEARMAEGFGEAYDAYRARVRRWI